MHAVSQLLIDLKSKSVDRSAPGESRSDAENATSEKSSDNRKAAQANASHEAGLMRYCACEVGNQDASMTTKVTVETHDWPVAVSVKDIVEDGCSIGVRRVEPNSREEFHLTNTRSIKFEELPIPQPASEDLDAELRTATVASVG